jgi:periplasmic divalent cation tolerance protein
LSKNTEKPGYIIVHVTVKDIEEGRKIARSVVKRRLAACVNIIPEVESHFWWKDKLETAKEVILFIKTKEMLLPELKKAIKKLHSYHIPEIIALPISGGSRDYLEWIESEIIEADRN